MGARRSGRRRRRRWLDPRSGRCRPPTRRERRGRRSGTGRPTCRWWRPRPRRRGRCPRGDGYGPSVQRGRPVVGVSNPQWLGRAGPGAAELGRDRQRPRARRPRGPRPRPRPHRPRRPATSALVAGPVGRLRRLRPHGRLPPRRPPLGQLVLRRFQTAGHRPIAAGRRRHGHDRRPRRPLRRAQPARPEHAAGTTSPPSRSSSAAAPRLRRRGRQATLVDNARLDRAASTLLDFLRDVGKHVTVNQMLAKDSVRTRLESEHGHLLHRVQLHAPAGQRLPVAARAPRLRAPARRLRPVGQHHRRHRPDPAPAGRRPSTA